jgi:aminoglycoside 6'-N-acetyltransferase I
LNIRTFLPDDFDRCVKLFINVFNSEPWNDNWTCERAGQYLMDFVGTPGFIGIVAAHNEEVNGLLFGVRKRWWREDELFINEMCVRSDKQRSGIGTKMIEYLDRFLNEEGIRTVTLLTNRGIAAEEFYKKNRFKEINRIVFMAKKIDC